MSLRDEIKQTKPFASPLEELALNIVRTASELSYAASEAFRPYGITSTQYNVLRILRGAGPEGLPCGAIAERMITRDSDITRLLDRMDGLNLIDRGRLPGDRRVVTVRLTEAGSVLVNRLDPVVNDLHASLLGHLQPEILKSLIGGLEKARTRPAVPLQPSHA